MSDERITLEGIEKDAREELRDRWENYRDEFHRGEPHDVISEIADSSVPVYTSDLLELAAGHNSLGVDEPEIGPAFDGAPTPTNIIAANVYEAVQAACWDEWQTIQNEANDDEGEA